jgi:predicted phage baseplate assembly protein
VLWTQVTDPADAGPADRVYGLDDADGTITFGDGQHGMIPPIGTNNIVAERYQTGGGERANAIKPWTALNLVTPIAGVNATIAPEGAAGGADPQDADTTLRFAPANVKLRDRALTLADLETLALQFSRDIAQAKAVRTAEGVRLLVAMRGPHPIPGAAVRRALDAYLKAHASPALASGDALKVADPDIVEVRVELRLVIDAIEWSGTVARDVGRRMRELLDPATGGRDQRGWPFGAWPGDSEIAATLDGVAHLEGIDRVTVARTRGGPPSALTPLQLVTLAPDGVVVDMVLEEALV